MKGVKVIEIKQILPAEDWYALFEQEKGIPPVTERIAVWASMVIDDGGELYHNIQGYADADGYLDSVEEASNFIRYCHKDDLKEAI